MESMLKRWSDKLGILPVNFHHNQVDTLHTHALLDGPLNNFCLAFDYDCEPEQSFNQIWSANMSNLVVVKKDEIELYSIKLGETPQVLSYSSVMRDITKFTGFLKSISLKEDDTIVPFVMSHFREIRFDLREEDSASNSLKVFLYIISQLGSLDNTWLLPSDTNQAVQSMRSSYLLEDVIGRLKEGTSTGLKPDVEMILRHCAGQLFQEANYMAQFNPQLELFPFTNYRITRSQRQVGSYFTPLYIARSIVEETLRQIDGIGNKEKLIIFDPACGSGVFLVEALRQLRSGNYKKDVEIIGWDIDPLAKAMADFVLQYESSEWAGRLKFKIEVKDSLSYYQEWPKSDVIFMNPPYISWSLMNTEQREQVTTIMGQTSTNRPNLASMFYLLASRSLSHGGCIGSLMPSSFLTTDAAKEIRNQANENVRPTLICNLGGFVFSSVMADVSIVVASNKELSPNVQMVWTRNRDDVAPVALHELRKLNTVQYTIEESPDYNIYYTRYSELKNYDTWKCLSRDSYLLKRRMLEIVHNEAFETASNLFEIKQGARTGANTVFIVSKDYYDSLPKSERQYFRPSVDNASIDAGRLTTTNYLFYPYNDDTLVITDEETLKRDVPHYYKTHLQPNQKKLSLRSKIDSSKWWALTWPRNWQFGKKSKLVSTEFGKSGSFAYDRTGEFVVERGLVWLPKREAFEEEDYYRYIALMNSPFFDRLLELFSNELIGGVYNLETKYMQNIPLPTFDNMDEYIRSILFDCGRQMSNGKEINIALLERLIRGIYGEK